MSFQYKQHDKLKFKKSGSAPADLQGLEVTIIWVSDTDIVVSLSDPEVSIGAFTHMYPLEEVEEIFEKVDNISPPLLPEIKECICPKSTWYVEGCKCSAGQRSLELERKQRCI